MDPAARSAAAPAPRNARGLATARRIHRAAVHLAATVGLDALTVDAVCAEAGISQRTFFHHYPTKDDALLGTDLPSVSTERANRYLSDPTVPILSGAVALIDLPVVADEDPATHLAQLRLLAGSPALQARQAQRFMPVLHELRGLVRLRLEALARAEGHDVDEATLDEQADLVTALGAALANAAVRRLVDGERVALPDLARVTEPLEGLWGQLV
ncbi:TetR/AcrR family transcriptional regulator [Aquipuribacter nitratireducens]|uniref:TetR/AcrR family transcriptional regulator n=1 Tax=Aquipuribacter nitratireducens TaxID=650104 RepID=A0ABW0GQ87_9MICO